MSPCRIVVITVLGLFIQNVAAPKEFTLLKPRAFYFLTPTKEEPMAIHPLACDLPPSPSLSPEDIMASRRPTSSPLPLFFQLDDDAPLPIDQDYDSSIAFPTPYPQQRAFSVSEVPDIEPPPRHNHRHSSGYPGRRHNMFGPYVMLQTLGEGEFGKVKLAIHSETGQEVRP